MKTPEEIKTALECCASLGFGNCARCPYNNDAQCVHLVEDGLAYIKQLEAERDSALSLIGKLAVILRNFPHADAKECANKAYNAVKNWMLFDMRKLSKPKEE